MRRTARVNTASAVRMASGYANGPAVSELGALLGAYPANADETLHADPSPRRSCLRAVLWAPIRVATACLIHHSDCDLEEPTAFDATLFEHGAERMGHSQPSEATTSPSRAESGALHRLTPALALPGPVLPVPDQNSPRQPPLLPPQSATYVGKPTVVFDLDETLVQNRLGPGLTIERPHLRELLCSLRGRCELILWTASREEIAEPVVHRITGGDSTLFQHCIFRDHTPRWFSDDERRYTKDLSRLGRDMQRTIIVENSASCVRLNPGHALMVEDWWGDASGDDSLQSVQHIISELCTQTGISVPDLLRQSPLLQPRSCPVPRNDQSPVVQELLYVVPTPPTAAVTPDRLPGFVPKHLLQATA